jgi:2-polyprenyl-6-methoxyphenol hydroxylase-like FAD-dependent oxidoreductase
MYDAIVVGARCAGSPTAMLLARRGFKVLLVDKATFPSDTISTHILWPHGAEILRRWGLLSRLAATGVPPICRPMTFDVGPLALRGTIPDVNDGMGGFCPRRIVLDALLVNAAAESGADAREGFTVEELLVEDETVVGVRGHAKGAKSVEERARIVIGADGVNSFVARLWRALEAAPDFLARVREGRREEKWYGTAGVPGYFRKPYGKGWALVGDAGYNRDPITAQGISDAFIDAEALVEALSPWLSGNGQFDESLATHESARNERVRPMYEFTTHLAALEPPPPDMQALFGALRHNPDATNAFLSAITGAIPLADFMSDDNVGRIMAAANGVVHG